MLLVLITTIIIINAISLCILVPTEFIEFDILYGFGGLLIL